MSLPALPTLGAMRTTEPVDLEGNAQGSVTAGVAVASSAALPGGVYAVWSDQDCYIQVSVAQSGLSTTTGYLIRGSQNPVLVGVRNQSLISAIQGTTAGTLHYHKVG